MTKGVREYSYEFRKWMDELDRVALSEDFEPEAEELDDRNPAFVSLWEERFNKGMSPKEAWDSVPAK